MKIFTPGIFGWTNKPASACYRFALVPVLFTILFFFTGLLSKAERVKNSYNPLLSNNNNGLGKHWVNSPLTTESMRSNLYLLNADNSIILADGVLTEYNNLYHDSVTLEDAYKFTNIKENLGLVRYGSTLAVERRPVIGIYDTLYFKLWKTTQRNYQIQFIATNLDHPGLVAFLTDSYLGTSTPLDLAGTTKINISVNSDVASANVNRFKIIYQTVSSATLPVTFTFVKAYQVNEKISIDWKVENEINIEKYEVEKSLTGTVFTRITTIPVVGTNAAFGNYSYADANAENGNNFYRIKSIDRNGPIKYSPIAKVVTGKNTGAITIYPNPIRGNSINLQFTNQPKGIYQVKLVNSAGQAVYSGTISLNSANISQPLFTNTRLTGGLYQLEIKKPDNTVEVHKAIVQQ